MHRLLLRQLARLGLSRDAAPDLKAWQAILERVDRTYTQDDQDRYTIERSLLTSSREMQVLHGDLSRSEAKFKMLVERSPDATFVCRSARIQYANPRMAEILGYSSPAELLDVAPLDAFVHDDDRDDLREYMRRRDLDEPVGAIELRWVRRDGEIVHVRAHSTPVVLDDAPAILVVARDITDAVLAQAEKDSVARSLRVSEERYRLLFEATPLPTALLDASSHRFLAVNEAAAQLYGYSREELSNMKLSDLEASVDAPASAAPASFTCSKGLKKHRRKDGSLIDLELVTHAMIVDEVSAILAIGTDVTEKRRTEEQLRQSQKMDAIGRLAGGIAHDFNNLLSVILTDVQLAASDLGDQHPVYPDLKEIEAAALRAAALTHQLLMFSRRRPRTPEPLSLNSAVTAFERMLRRIIGVDVRITTRLATQLDTIDADPGQIDQVLLNLVVNARDAMPSGGELGIETKNVELDRKLADRVGVAPGPYAMLAVSDTGIGMDAATRGHIFEPFFTTKEVGKGTGLGLATVFGVVKQSNGGIDVESEPGKGSTFRVYFPRVASAANHASKDIGASSRGSETILLVEDDAQVRRVIGRLLASHGYRVIEARNGAEALEELTLRGDAVDLIVTDLAMPEMDGRTMAGRILGRNPGAKILYMSAYSDHVALKGAALERSDHFIHKPFTMEELALAVRRAIDGRRSYSPSVIDRTES